MSINKEYKETNITELKEFGVVFVGEQTDTTNKWAFTTDECDIVERISATSAKALIESDVVRFMKTSELEEYNDWSVDLESWIETWEEVTEEELWEMLVIDADNEAKEEK